MNPCSDENPLTYRVGKYEFRKLVAQEEIRYAEKLLHDVYIVEQEWGISADNPSGLEVKRFKKHNFQYLTDSHSDVAHWFGAFHRNELVGCFRLMEHSESELEKYFKLPYWLKRTSPCELNRLAVSEKHRGKKIVMLMLKRISFDCAFYLNNTVYVTAEYPRLSKLYAKLGLIESGIRFKYHDHEDHMVELLYYDAEINDRFKTALYRLTDKYILARTEQS